MTVESFLERWQLRRDGEPYPSSRSIVLPVIWRDVPAVLKIAEEEERLGAILMRWWDGDGAARVLAIDEPGGALLLERATGHRDLVAMAADGRTAEAYEILCATAARLHGPRGTLPYGLPTLDRWFASLRRVATVEGGIFAEALPLAEGLIASQREWTVLHGDLHHGNVLDFGERGWLAIDPKRLFGERTFDYVNLVRNPDPSTAPDKASFVRSIESICGFAGLERGRLLEWTFAFAALSAAWFAEDGDYPPEFLADLEVAALARAELAS